MVFVREKKRRIITSLKTAPLFVCAETVRPYMNIFDGLMDKEAAP